MKMKLKLKGNDVNRIVLALRYAITKIKGSVPNKEVDKFQQLYDRLTTPSEESEKVDYYGDIGEVYGGSKPKCENCDG